MASPGAPARSRTSRWASGRRPGRYLYSLFGEIIRETKARDPDHLITMANGDVQYIDLVGQECKGSTSSAPTSTAASRPETSSRSSRTSWASRFCSPSSAPTPGTPGRCARMASTRPSTCWPTGGRSTSSRPARGACRTPSAASLSSGATAGWKYKQTEKLDIHDVTASWPHGYRYDFVEGENNMNEEWFGVCAKGPRPARPLRPLPARRLLRAARGLQAPALRPRHRPRRHRQGVQRHRAGGARGHRPHQPGQPGLRHRRAHPAQQRPAPVLDLQHRRDEHHHPEQAEPQPTLPPTWASAPWSRSSWESRCSR